MLAFFAHDANESTVIKRVNAFEANGAQVLGLMFKRDRPGLARETTWHNIDLGSTRDRNYVLRLPKLAAAIVRAVRHRAVLRQCTIFYARNIDMLFVAAAVRWAIGARVPLAYEVLDVQRVFVGDGWINRLFRWLERRLLAQSRLLVVSSPDFMSMYFWPMQGYRGEWFLLENKVHASQALRPALQDDGMAAARPWVIGWFGTLRCVRSLGLLCDIADALGDRVQIHIRGTPSEEDLKLEQLEGAARLHPNVRFFGRYSSPGDLPAIYGQVHFSWSVDYLDAGANSDWLLPNRVYEGGLYGAVALARKGTATGRFVEKWGLGSAFPEPLGQSVTAYLQALDTDSYAHARRAIKQMDRSFFVDEEDTGKLLRLLCAGPHGPPTP